MDEDAVALVAAALGTSTARARRLARTALPPGFARSAREAAVRGRAVLLVEGATDAAVLGPLLHGPSGPVVLAVGGKHLLPLAGAVAQALGASWHAVVDGDADGWRRARNRSRARTTHHRATAQVLRLLPPQRVTVLPDALEAELALWPSFVAALRAHGGDLTGPGAKDPARYAAAAAAATAADAPALLLALRQPPPPPTR
ncbi:hypothetical protein MO973_17290 [Paenibacillus sp. TRM 82003]|uniref:hypothetical protein n=1 Tax=Kineococcus sp. TRM81007 TaxID=2925831 RepID=UPI001F561490|nr:hypothetical protein [Kineococcus sp. TRM81007]MCI2238501.1 hypothetical protein [Kineococcus sp. TRM81007]MCI3921986.1 hypothetical protein [Paenibacillus sp. TRM 82003]